MTRGARRTKRPPSLREKLERSHAAVSFYARGFGHEPPPKPALLQQIEARAANRKPRSAPDPADSEAPVISAVGELLAVHPAVLFAVRANSGAMHVEGANGRAHPVFFYKLVRRPGASEITITDFWGFLRDGRPFAIECKRPSWKAPRGTRELDQQAFIHMVESIGGVGGFARSADEANAILAGPML